MISIRLPKSLINFIDGIDYALFYFYTNNHLKIDVKDYQAMIENNQKNQHRKIEFNSVKSNLYLESITTDTKKSKSEIIRRCLYWLSKQANYPKNFKE